ncbi:MAG TPA: DUF2844 domain-containing protein [Thermoleophilia bacterium]|nr:DUF2844 domain-containing protein [Thermoleophilia bacterium]
MTRTQSWRVGSRLLAVALALWVAPPGWASLGEPAASVTADQQALRGELLSSAGAGYEVHQIKAADGSIVREYVSPSGVVFGIGWQGPTNPSLELLLGAHFKEFQAAAQAARRYRRPLAVHTDGLVVEVGGHMRAFHGRAYVPQLLPDAATAAVVR